MTITEKRQILIGKSYEVFEMSIKSLETLKKYRPRLRMVLESIGLDTEQCAKLGLEQPKALQAELQKYVISLVERNKRTGRPKAGTIRSVLKPIQKFCVMNDIITINWPKLKSFIPANTPPDDRMIRKEEIQELYKHADIRERVMLTIRASSGMRIGSLVHLRFKDIQPVRVEELKAIRADLQPKLTYDDIVAAKVKVYDTKGSRYYNTFISPEAYQDTEEYRKYRERYGEKITPDSPIIRDKFDKRGLAGVPTPVSVDTLRNIMQDLIYRAGLRKRDDHKVRHEWQATHAFRKFFRTMAWQEIGSDTANLLMGHSLGIDDSYLKPEHELLAEYLKIVPLVTINQQTLPSDNSSKIDQLEQTSKELVARVETLEQDKVNLNAIVESLMQRLAGPKVLIEGGMVVDERYRFNDMASFWERAEARI